MTISSVTHTPFPPSSRSAAWHPATWPCQMRHTPHRRQGSARVCPRSWLSPRHTHTQPPQRTSFDHPTGGMDIGHRLITPCFGTTTLSRSPQITHTLFLFLVFLVYLSHRKKPGSDHSAPYAETILRGLYNATPFLTKGVLYLCVI